MTGLIYDAAMAAYAGAVRLAACRPGKARLMRRGHREVWRRLREGIDPARPCVWIHASSLGEFEQGRPLMEMLRRRRPDTFILLTFFSPSGYQVRKDWPGADLVCHLPFDLPRNVDRFLDIVRPCVAIFVKYEFWRNYLLALERRRIPTYLISAPFRSSQLFFKPHGGWYRRLLRCFTTLMVQDEDSRRLLASIGVRNVAVCGDTRFDRVSDILSARRPLPLLESFAGDDAGPVFIAGSSWPSDEGVYLPWLKAHREVRAVIAPHEFDDARVRHLLAEFPGEAVAWSEAIADPSLLRGRRVLVMDCFGLLSSAYRYASVAYVGGGFGAGLHNINEAAVYGIPVVYGPNNARFIEARELRVAGGGFEVASGAAFASVADSMLLPELRRKAGEAAGAYIRSRLGATRRVYDIIFGADTGPDATAAKKGQHPGASLHI